MRSSWLILPDLCSWATEHPGWAAAEQQNCFKRQSSPRGSVLAHLNLPQASFKSETTAHLHMHSIPPNHLPEHLTECSHRLSPAVRGRRVDLPSVQPEVRWCGPRQQWGSQAPCRDAWWHGRLWGRVVVEVRCPGLRRTPRMPHAALYAWLAHAFCLLLRSLPAIILILISGHDFGLRNTVSGANRKYEVPHCWGSICPSPWHCFAFYQVRIHRGMLSSRAASSTPSRLICMRLQQDRAIFCVPGPSSAF